MGLSKSNSIHGATDVEKDQFSFHFEYLLFYFFKLEIKTHLTWFSFYLFFEREVSVGMNCPSK